MASSFLSNQGSQTALLTDTTGGTAGTMIPVMKIDTSAQGTAGAIWGGGVTGTINSGSIVVTAGTVSSLPNIPGGTLALVSAIGTIGTVGLATVSGNLGTIGTIGLATVTGNVGVSSGTVTQLPNIPGGSIAVTTGTIPTLGTMGTLGLVNTLTTLSNLSAGSVNIIAGTIATLGTMGTLGLVNTVTTVSNITNGSIVQTVGTVNTGTINTGTFVMPSGTVTVLPNLPQGSINVTAGTFRQDARTTQNIITFGTSYGTSGAGASTIIGSTAVGAGTSVWLNDFSIMNNNANVTCILGFGTAQQGTNVLFRGSLGTAGAVGIEKIYPRAVNAGMTNQDLVFSLTGAGTVDLSVSYLISA